MSVSREQLVSAVASALSKRQGCRRLAVRSAVRYEGPDALEVNGQTWTVRWADSSLRARRVLSAAAEGGAAEDGGLLLVTPLSDSDLGLEVLARLDGTRVQDLDPWDEVKYRFAAAQLDPRVATHQWMAAEVLEAADASPSPVTGGVLDLDRLWAELLRPLGIAARSPGRPTVGEVLAASALGELAEGVERLRPRTREHLPDRLGAVAGPLGEVLGRMIVAGQGPSLLPIGLVLDAITAEATPLLPETAGAMSPRERVKVRLTDRHGVAETLVDGERGAEWARAAVRWAESAEPEARRSVCEAADAMLRDYGGEPLAGLSRFLPSGRARRRARLGEAIRAFLEAAGSAAAERLADVEAAAELVLACGGGATEQRRVRMARRVCRWMVAGGGAASDAGAPATLADLAVAERDEGSWADRARLSLVGGGESNELDAALTALAEAAADRREAAAERFARRLAEVHPADGGPAHGGEVLPLERLIPEVAGRVIESGQKVLLVVMDGMSHAVMHALAGSIAARGGFERLTPAGHAAWPPVLAPLPTITEVARASLLSGEVTGGGQDVEQSGFAALVDRHGWRGQVGADRKLLFHKGELSKKAGSLSSDLIGVLESTAKLVGVIVNAVDDLLDKGDQIQPEWSLGELPLLEALVSQAELYRRVIVLTADHGHVLDRGGTESIGSEQAAARWRSLGDRRAGDREVVVGGPRVKVPKAGESDSAVVLPWSERCRYGRKAAGYHGGANPQEVCVPLAVFVPTAAVEAMGDGWQAEAAEPPGWWSDARGATGAVPDVSGAARAAERQERERPRPAPESEPAATLFEPSPPPPPPERESTAAASTSTDRDWIDAVLASETYEQQQQFAGRHPPSREAVAKVLVALDQAGGALTESALASRIGTSPMRLRGVLQGVAAILNVDGYAAIEQDRASSTVRLDRDRLRRQFVGGET